MRLVFMGTPDFAVPSLQAIYDAGHEIAGVFTQPDRPAGRGNKMKASPVKVLAESLGIQVFQPQKVREAEAVQKLEELLPDCIVVVAYGQILPSEILDLPKHGCVNVHASLLPHYRGAAPIHWAVINGEKVTGVTTMLMDEGLDTGDILLVKKLKIGNDMTTGEVHDELAELGAEILTSTLERLEEGSVKPIPQPSNFSYAPLLKREHEEVNWEKNSEEIHNQIRGLNPWPGAFTLFRGQQIKIWNSKLIEDKKTQKYHANQLLKPGMIVDISENGIVCAAGKGYIEIREVQPSGKKRMPAFDFFNGRHCELGEQFGF